MGRGFLLFALLVTGGLTLLLGHPASSERHALELETIVVSGKEAEVVITADTLRRGEVLTQVLARQDMSGSEISEVVDALRVYANPRLLRPGVTVAVQRTAWDSLIDVTVRVDPDHQVTVGPSDVGWMAELSELPVAIDTLVITGSINTSLYHSVMALQAGSIGDQERIEQIMWGIYRPFQWSIDFGIDLRKGDHYRAVYERRVRSDGSVQPGRVLAAEFTNRGKTYRAYWFDERGEYYDENGKSMKKVFLKAPVDFRRISSRFARRRYHPKLGIYRAHLGTDYAAATGTRVYSTADGTVTRAGWWGGYGRMIEIRHVNGYRTRYAHLSFVAKGIRRGIRVRQGQLIGYVGQTGLATGPHLHYELRQNGRALDPRRVNVPSGLPVPETQLAQFRRLRQRLQALLDRAADSGVKRVD